MSAAHLATFEAACQAAGKHLCSKQEWYLSCTGTARTTYSWGNAFDPEICNCVDTYCDDYCASEGIPAEDCYTASNCGYYCGAKCPSGSCADATCTAPYCSGSVWCHEVRPTGSFAGCVDEFGAFDVNGNVWEVVPSTADARGYEVRGGAFNCASPAARLQCTFNAGWTALNAGFRCCRAPE
jgi:formylglycine-generating enzyme required for sulfatase activity